MSAAESNRGRRRGRWALGIFMGLISFALIWIWFFHDAQR
jgi:hypothetical protein